MIDNKYFWTITITAVILTALYELLKYLTA